MADNQPPAAESQKDKDPTALRTRWTEIELLPKWGEEFYDVYTAKKYGKWVMLKTLKPEYRDKPEYQAMIEKEFDARYNLSHPNIVMINDYEEVPGLGMCIITDDVYGDSLRKLIDENRITEKHLDQLKTRLPDAMEYIQLNHLAHHPITPETIIFTEKIGNLKLIDVGFEQKKSLSHDDTNNDIENYGEILLEVIEKSDITAPDLRRIAERCIGRDTKKAYRDVQSLRMALDGRSNKKIYFLMGFMVCVLAFILGWLLVHGA